ncbi:single-stranded-DNA-specific exonuclease RecJ [Lottiidibacillus patelloidae]|uniref:Single-stranded-DNA-specific exonuclease RecJ n=1 Tax=Lottiidibacillus patelloidae TaxID=2670334 RepID=A0A263BXC1_9BACI|nr:single-stranded-DNA-specific exonuclease RecJ [Lottiidibacillus patelloidae]OZM57826.1 single-stranded-DNA-specific exonuclease RecJ [Lottiidibacillus patelloidae]
MLKAKSRWKLRKFDEEKAQSLAEILQIELLVARLLVMRGIETIEEAKRFLFIEPMEFHDPFLLEGMAGTVKRIKDAITNNEKILIFGDYDADGVSSTTVLMVTLQDLGADVDFYIPNRFTEGYGPNEQAFRWAKSAGYSLVITVDTGISAIAEADVAKEIGLDYIITDHHEPSPQLPAADFIIHPKLSPNYPFHELAGVGVAFKLAHALYGEVPQQLLEIAAIGTIADLVPLVDENRIIASRGVAMMSRSTRIGIKALLKVCGLEGQVLTAENIGFAIGPRINAVGRLESADPAVHLLLSDSIEEAEELANEIDGLNKERQKLVNTMTEEAYEMIDRYFPPADNEVLVIAKEGWNPGVVGIVASRVVEKYYRPTIILSIDKEKGIAKGSARSIEGFDLFANLSKCRDILPHFGGHPMAAGMTLDLSNVDLLRSRLKEQAKEILTEEDFIPIKHVDIECNLEDVTIATIEQINRLAPFGVQNPSPKVLLTCEKIHEMKTVGASQNHLKMTLAQENSTIDTIGFNLGEKLEHISPLAKIAVVGELGINEWNGFRKPQLLLEDLAVQDWQLFDFRSSRNVAKKLEEMPQDKIQLVSFQDGTMERLQLEKWSESLLQLDKESTPKLLKNGYLFLLDLPTSMEQLQNFFNGNSFPERIYAVFHHDNDHYFSTLPTRDHFKWFYGFLLKKQTFDLKKHGEDLAKHKGWSKQTVNFMSKVFFELEFVKIEDGLLTINHVNTKRDLTESKSYQSKKEQMDLENELCYSSYRSLMTLLQQCKDNSVRDEEEIEDGLQKAHYSS